MNIINSNIAWNGSPDLSNKPEYVILHHAEASACTVYDIDRWHKERGWLGIGYQYFVRKDGSVYTGRPENAVGAHTLGYNFNSIGICAEGAYMTETMPAAQKNAIEELIRDIKGRYNIKAIFGHGEVYPTDCPGKNYPLAQIKNEVLNPVVPYPGYYIRYNPNVYDENCKKVQEKLGCGADGYFGSITKNAVIRFQQAHGLDADGIVGPCTWKAIFG